MKRTITSIVIVGGPEDGQVTIPRKPWAVDEHEVLEIRSGAKRYRIKQIEGTTAYFEEI